MDSERLADIRAGTPETFRSGGSGYLIGRRLVLTCRHVVTDGQGQVWPRLQVRLGHPGAGRQHQAVASVVWVHPEPERDAALLRIDGDLVEPDSLVRWGWPLGTDPVAYTGLGYPLFADYESGRGVEQLQGTLPPLGLGADGSYVLDQGPAPEAAAGRVWPGVSGSAVFCQDLLTGVVTKDDAQFGNRRLHAVPAWALAADAEFSRLVAEDAGTPLVLEAVELAAFLEQPQRQVLPGTPASLLAAGVEAVEFTGREAELAELDAWRDDTQKFSALLITGEGGQGKTRLAREFAARSRVAGWAAGFLQPRSGVAADESRYVQSAVQLASRARQATRPVLLVADYAEIRFEEVAALTHVLSTESVSRPVRLLLLSRTSGAWLNSLADDVGLELARQIELSSLTDTLELREEIYRRALRGLARMLERLRDQPPRRAPGLSWSVAAERLALELPALADPGLGNALTLQMAALADLLDAGAGEAPSAATSAEAKLVRHERNYLRRVAAKRELFDPGRLSDRTDPHERTAEARTALERALAGVILLGPCDREHAQKIGALSSPAISEDVTSWLAALYPPSAPENAIGAVQPDRVAELLLGPILVDQQNLLPDIGALAEDFVDARAALFTLVRTAARQEFEQIAAQISKLIAGRPNPFAAAALFLASRLSQAGPLQSGLVALGQDNPTAFGDTVYALLGQLPSVSVSGASFSAAITMTATNILRQLAEASPDVYLSDLAGLLNNLGVRLAAIGRGQEALAAAQEAERMSRRLAEGRADDYLSLLAASLINLGDRLAETGQRQAALAPVEEAVAISSQLADANPDAYLPAVGTSLTSLGNRLAEVGQRQAALAAAQEAEGIYRRLAEASPHVYLPALAKCLNNLGIRLADVGQRQAALGPAQEAEGIYRRLAEASPDTFLPDLAASLSNLGGRLADVGQRQAALSAVQEAVAIRRLLAEDSPDAYLPDLAMSLNSLGAQLTEAGQRQAALAATQEAVAIRRLLAEDSPDAHLPDLAMSLTNLGAQLAAVGQRQAAVTPIQEAVDIGRLLAEDSPDAYLPDLAASLNNLASQLAENGQAQAALAPVQEAAAIYRQLAGATPDAYLPALAASLTNLGNVLAETGQQHAALAAAQEAVAIRRALAESSPEVYLPDVATSLSNLGIQLAATGDRRAALAAAQESVAILRPLADTSPDAYLPVLAMSLHNLAIWLTSAERRQEALAAAQEAVAMRRQLAEANPDAHLPDLATSLKLSALLTESEADTLWESAIASVRERPAQVALTVAYAEYLLDQPDALPGLRLLTQVLTMPELPGPVEKDARQLLRAQWREHPEQVEQSWRAVSPAALPDWLSVSDEQLDTVRGWIDSATWADSRDYFRDHATQLQEPITNVVLDELALTVPGQIIEKHRALLTAISGSGPDHVYRIQILAETLTAWLDMPNLETSREYLREHAELLDADVPGLLGYLRERADPRVEIHKALLVLANDPAGIDAAYQCAEDKHALQAMASHAITTADAPRLRACGLIEAYAHGRALTGTLYMIVAGMLADPEAKHADKFERDLSGLAAQADAAQRADAIAIVEAASHSLPLTATIGTLRRAVSGSDGGQA